MELLFLNTRTLRPNDCREILRQTYGKSLRPEISRLNDDFAAFAVGILCKNTLNIG